MPYKANEARRHKIPRARYKVANWPAYDRALQQRGSSTVWVTPEALAAWQPPRTGQRGRPRNYSDVAIETGHLLRLTFGRPWRQTEGLLRSLVTLLNLDVGVPDHTTFSRRSPGLALATSLAHAQASGPVHVVIDATGLKVYGAGEWLVAKHGDRRIVLVETPGSPSCGARMHIAPSVAPPSASPFGGGPMTWPIKRLPHLLALALGIVPAASAQAQVPLFLDTCVAKAGDLDSLPLAFAKAGLVEVDRAAGPPGPAIAALIPDRRLWSAPGGSGMGEIFAGYSPLGDTPLAVCWTVSRPGLSAADMLVELKRRFPPDHGATSRGTEAFYGGSETWATEVRGSQVIVGVNWPIRQSPDQGTSLIYLAKPRQ